MCAYVYLTEGERLYTGVHTRENCSTQEAGHMAEQGWLALMLENQREKEKEEKVEEEKMEISTFRHFLSGCKFLLWINLC